MVHKPSMESGLLLLKEGRAVKGKKAIFPPKYLKENVFVTALNSCSFKQARTNKKKTTSANTSLFYIQNMEEKAFISISVLGFSLPVLPQSSLGFGSP